MRKNNGSISLVMAIIMLSMFVLSAVINDGARMRAAATIVQSAADSAAMSVLAKYDVDLKDKYGLFTLEDTDKEAIVEDFTNFFSENLSSEFPLSSDFNRAVSGFVNSLGGSMGNERENPFDPYGESDLENASVDLAYSIIEPAVLQTQMAEFAKYRGFIAMSGVMPELSELTEQAESSSSDIKKIEETVGGGEGYKNYVQAAAEAYYDLTQILRSINFAGNMCNSGINHQDKRNEAFAWGKLDRETNEWSCMTKPDENLHHYVYDKINKNVNEISNEAKNNIIPELERYDALRAELEEKQRLYNEANERYNNANRANQEAQSAYNNARDAAANVDYLNNATENASAFFNLINNSFGSFVNEGLSEDDKNIINDEKQLFFILSNNFSGASLNGYSLNEYIQKRMGEEIDYLRDDEKKEDVNKAYNNAISLINKKISEINSNSYGGNAYTAANAAQNASSAAANTLSQAQTERAAAENACDEAQRALEAQYNLLVQRTHEWLNFTDNRLTTISSAAGEQTVGLLPDDNIHSLVNNRKLAFYSGTAGSRGREEFDGGMLAMITLAREQYGRAKEKLDDAINNVNSYISEVEGRSGISVENNIANPNSTESAKLKEENAMDWALLEDAKTALDELNKIKNKSNGNGTTPTIDTWLDNMNKYAVDLDKAATNLKNTANQMSSNNGNMHYALKNNIGDIDYYAFLKDCAKLAVNYDGSGENNMAAHKDKCVSIQDGFEKSYYDHEYIYEKNKILIGGEDVESGGDESKAGKLFSLFKDFNFSSYKNKNNNSIKFEVISDDEWDILPHNMYRNDGTGSDTTLRYHTVDRFRDEDKAYIQRVVNRYNLASMQLEEVDNVSSDIAEDKLDKLDNLSFGEDAKSQSDGFNLLSGLMDSISSFTTNLTNGLLVDYYDMSMFKSRVSKPASDWADFYSDKGVLEDLRKEDHNYDMKRYDPDNNEMNLYFREKDKDTFFGAEIEYILHGDKSEKSNENNIYLKIYGIRMVNNLIAVYQNSELRNLATVASSWAGPFAPLVQIAIIAVLAALETYFDMEFLIKYGYKIPFWKTSDNLVLSFDHIGDALEDGLGNINAPNCEDSHFLVSYETYLWFFMLLTGREDKLLRSADLMQLNIRQTDSGYIMGDHYTYIRCKTNARLKPLFLGLGFAPSNFSTFTEDRRGGADNDDNQYYTVESLNYQGY